MRYKEPFFMRELHKQREKDAKELYTVFGGDMRKWWKHKMDTIKDGTQGKKMKVPKK